MRTIIPRYFRVVRRECVLVREIESVVVDGRTLSETGDRARVERREAARRERRGGETSQERKEEVVGHPRIVDGGQPTGEPS